MPLSDSEKALIRNRAERKAVEAGVPITWVKMALNDATQIIVDTLDGVNQLQRAEISPAGTGFNLVMSLRIDNATSPYGVTFTNQEKKWLFAFVCEHVYVRDG